MPRFRAWAAAFVATTIAATFFASPAWSAADVARGAYLVNAAAACAGCHAGLPPGPGASLSGGRSFGAGASAVVAPNITPDRETGIGAWTDAQIAAAIRRGERPDGSRIGPPMPQLAYRAMRDDDVRAIVAYLRTLPPVSHAVPRAQRPPPPAPQGMPPAEAVGDAPAGRGRYLANALAHCTECHTPGPPSAPDFAGRLDAGGRTFPTPTGPVVAPSITADALGRFSDAELTALITQGKRPDGSSLKGPMPIRAYAKLTPEDVRALLAYLREPRRK